MCQASRPIANTSLVRLLMAITEGSLRTIPSPRAYTKVLAVPRSMARSRASGLSSQVGVRPVGWVGVARSVQASSPRTHVSEALSCPMTPVRHVCTTTASGRGGHRAVQRFREEPFDPLRSRGCLGPLGSSADIVRRKSAIASVEAGRSRRNNQATSDPITLSTKPMTRNNAGLIGTAPHRWVAVCRGG